MKRNKGFTIIELLIVISIIGILVAFGLSMKMSVETKVNTAIEQVQPNPNKLEPLE